MGGWPEAGREVYAEELAVAAGGHFNTAAALARLNVRVGLVAVVGDDLWGELVLRDVRAEGLPEELVEVVRDAPTPVSIALNDGGERGFVTYAPGWERVEKRLVSAARALIARGGARHVHGDLSAVSPQPLPAARAAGATISVDAHEAGPWLADARVHELVSHVDLLFANEDEALELTGAADWRAALDQLASATPHVVVKRGARGAAASVDGQLYEAPAADAEVVDATGAGDCFVAGYLWAHLGGRPPAECLELANRCGAAAVSALGGFRAAPREDELLAAAP